MPLRPWTFCARLQAPRFRARYCRYFPVSISFRSFLLVQHPLLEAAPKRRNVNCKRSNSQPFYYPPFYPVAGAEWDNRIRLRIPAFPSVNSFHYYTQFRSLCRLFTGCPDTSFLSAPLSNNGAHKNYFPSGAKIVNTKTNMRKKSLEAKRGPSCRKKPCCISVFISRFSFRKNQVRMRSRARFPDSTVIAGAFLKSA